MKCKVFSVRCKVLSEKCKVFSVQCKVLTAKSKVPSVKCKVFSVQCKVLSVKCKVFSVQCKVLSVQCAVCTMSNRSGASTQAPAREGFKLFLSYRPIEQGEGEGGEEGGRQRAKTKVRKFQLQAIFRAPYLHLLTIKTGPDPDSKYLQRCSKAILI